MNLNKGCSKIKRAAFVLFSIRHFVCQRSISQQDLNFENTNCRKKEAILWGQPHQNLFICYFTNFRFLYIESKSSSSSLFLTPLMSKVSKKGISSSANPSLMAIPVAILISLLFT